jgi:hypothetical protein
MREQSINRGCMARLGCLLQWLQCCNAASSTSSDGVLGGFRPRGLAQRTSRIRCLALAWLSPGSPLALLWLSSGSPTYE